MMSASSTIAGVHLGVAHSPFSTAAENRKSPCDAITSSSRRRFDLLNVIRALGRRA
jgi:hypothetical protein